MKGMRRYKPSDYKLIAGWYEARGLTPPSADFLSDIGYICDNRVAGWLYKTPSSIALIEGIISDPNSLPSLRKDSLTRLCCFIVDCATMLGFNHIIGSPSHPSIVNICESLGFKPSQARVYTLSVSEFEDTDEEIIMRFNIGK